MSLLTFGDFAAQLQEVENAPPSDPFALFGPSYFLGIAGSALLSFISLVLIYGIGAAVLARSIADNYLGESPGVIEAYRKIGGNWGRLIVALIIAILLSAGLFIWLLVPCVGWFTGPGILAFFWMVIVPLIAPAIVLEKQSGLGIRRAWDLTRRRFWWVLGFAFILTLFGQLVVTGPTFLVTFLSQLLVGSPFELGSPSSTFTLQTVIQSLIALIFGLIYLPLQLIGMILVYFDLRVRTEGLDLIFKSVPGGQINIEDIVAQAPQPEQGNIITLTEIGYFALITLGVIGVIFVVWLIGIAFGIAILAASGASGF
jgi:hypothetical protein